MAAVFDHHAGTAASLAIELGSTAAATLPEVTAACDVIFTVVSDAAGMSEIFLGENSLLQGAAGKLFINCATVSPAAHEAAEQAAAAAGAATLAASMASSIPQARQMLPGVLPTTYGGMVDALCDRLLFRRLDSAGKTAVLIFMGASPNKPLPKDSEWVTWRLPYVVALILSTPTFASRT